MRRAALLVLLVACGGSAAGGAESAQLTNIGQISLPGEVGLVTLGDQQFVFDRDAVSVVKEGFIVAHAAAPRADGAVSPWQAAAVLPGIDGTGAWVVGVAGGKLWRVHVDGRLESVGGRLGVDDSPVVAIAGAGSTFAIGRVGGLVASRDGKHALRFVRRDAPRVAAAVDEIAAWTSSTVDVFGFASGVTTSYRVSGVTFVGFLDALAEHATLVVVARDSIYFVTHRTLERAPAPSPVTDPVIAGSRLWFVSRGRLYAIDRHGLMRARNLPDDTHHIYGTTSGDLWFAVQRSHPKLEHYALGHSVQDPAWQARIDPIFQRSCARCHRPGGSADLDLSTAAAWRDERSEIVQRVLVSRTMPPEGTVLSDADRATLAAWLTPKALAK